MFDARRITTVVLALGVFAQAAAAADVAIAIDETQTFQTMDGFGASFTDSSAYLLYGSYGNGTLSPAQRDAVMQALFGEATGIRLSYLRQPIGTSDFRHAFDYSYDDVPAGQTDYDLSEFSIANDETYIIPALLDALAINPDVRIMGSPWSPPPWLKDSQAFGWGRLIDSDAIYATYADYFVKYVQAYSNWGIPIDAITLQNEPHFEPGSYPGMRMEPTDQARLVKQLGPKFAAAGISTKILVWDHNWDEYTYPVSVMWDPVARPYIAGSAFHCYGGDVANQSIVHNSQPDKDIYFTECSGGGWIPSFADTVLRFASDLIIGSTRHWAKNVCTWNIALDQNGGPKISGGCGNCAGVVTINSQTGAMTKNAEYYVLGHASRFVDPGAVRIDSSAATGDVENVAFLNPDGSFVLIVLNAESSSRSIAVSWQGQTLAYSLPARSLYTFAWPAGFHATAEVWRTLADSSTQRLQRVFDVTFAGGSPPGDLDGDGDVDVADAAIFANCMAGPQVFAAPGGCLATDFTNCDFDGDGDVDLADFEVFQPHHAAY
ncbi:MAG TPA: glycoside hydrolase family 30 beta sandwich domain-containing protein [Phycisphaerae bacterium]|nr:glycosyl hydrolase [Phycisphaerales bacterium]HRX84671.1 glycoside hydrolase family 30 beta sandwich domain-containing protein [Phycisphaerae bacterium]